MIGSRQIDFMARWISENTNPNWNSPNSHRAAVMKFAEALGEEINKLSGNKKPFDLDRFRESVEFYDSYV